jgi:hypothetical protein
VVSNLSYMNLVMMLVFPTDWSPRNTSLYLANADTTAIARAPTTVPPSIDRFQRSRGANPRSRAARWCEEEEEEAEATTTRARRCSQGRGWRERGGGVSSGCGRAYDRGAAPRWLDFSPRLGWAGSNGEYRPALYSL